MKRNDLLVVIMLIAVPLFGAIMAWLGYLIGQEVRDGDIQGVSDDVRRDCESVQCSSSYYTSCTGHNQTPESKDVLEACPSPTAVESGAYDPGGGGGSVPGSYMLGGCQIRDGCYVVCPTVATPTKDSAYTPTQVCKPTNTDAPPPEDTPVPPTNTPRLPTDIPPIPTGFVPTATEPAPEPDPKPKCNRGVGNLEEGCDPGNSGGQGQGDGRPAGEDRDEDKGPPKQGKDKR